MALINTVKIKLGKFQLKTYLADNIFTVALSKRSREKTYFAWRRVSFLGKDGNSHKMHIVHFFLLTLCWQFTEEAETGIEPFAFDRVDFDDEPAEELDV
jgi:hypothetical protein